MIRQLSAHFVFKCKIIIAENKLVGNNLSTPSICAIEWYPNSDFERIQFQLLHLRYYD